MSEFLEQLAARNLDEPTMAVRPRLLSRFEAHGSGDQEPLVQDANIEESRPNVDVAAPSPLIRHEATPDVGSGSQVNQRPARSQPFVDDASSPSRPLDAMGPVEVASENEQSWPPSEETGSLAKRLDEIDVQLSRLSFLPANESPTQSGSPPFVETESERRESKISVERHEHRDSHQHTHQHETTQQITNLIRHTVGENATQPAPSIRSPLTETQPQPTASGITPVIEPSTKRSADQQVSLPPIVIEKHIEASAPKNESTTPTPQQTSPPPRIVVEDNSRKESEKHTVTVTIGRIEVRAPQKPTVPVASKPSRPAARIMSLDDYMRRRVGGVG